jgi:sugar phosphate isomerase/epimerase
MSGRHEGLMMITRRRFSQSALAGVVFPAVTGRWPAAPIGGVHIGVQTYSFRELPRPPQGDAVDVIISAMKTCGLDECELWSPQLEPAAAAAATADARQSTREALRRWRLSTPASHFEAIRNRFADAGLTIFAYNLSFSDSFTDTEIDRGFAQARALGVDTITASTTLAVAQRVVPFAERHKMRVAMHNHSRLDDPNEFATPASFITALALSPYYYVNLDIGHFTAAGFDALAFLQEHHGRITNLHLKDRKRAQGANMAWGEGDTPIRDVLQWLKAKRSPVRAYIEYEYKGRGAIEEVKTCLEYTRRALA